MQSVTQPVPANTSTPAPTPVQNNNSIEWFCDERWAAADKIFVGTVKEIKPPENLSEKKQTELKSRLPEVALKNVIRFQIEKAFKGSEKAAQIEMLNLQTAESPAIDFKPGEKYLLYLETATINKGEPLFYFARPDGKTRPYSESAETIAFLEKNFDRNITEEVLGSTARNVVIGGIVSGKATNVVKPPYPEEAKKDKASGKIQVLVLIDETGRVIKAKAICPIHPALGKAAEQAALSSQYSPILISGKPVKVSGIIVYNFVQ